MALRETKPQVSPLRLKITVLIAGFGPLVAIGLWLQSKGFSTDAMHRFLATAGLLGLGLLPSVSWAETMTAQVGADF